MLVFNLTVAFAGQSTHLHHRAEDDHLAGRKIDIINYEPRTLKSDLARQQRLSADESVRLGHFPMLENPHAFNQQLLGAIKALTERAGRSA
jgi:hypothetical protein